MAKDSSGKRLPWIKLWAVDFMADPFVQALAWDKRGRFFWAVMCSWETDTPGYAPEEMWVIWMGYNDETWEEAKRWFFGILRPIDPPKGQEDQTYLLQKRLANEYVHAKEESDRLTNRGVAGAEARWNAKAMPKHYGSNAQGMPTSTSTSIREKQKTTPLPTDVGGSVLKSPVKEKQTKDPDDKDWVEMFDWFWGLYPRKVGRPAAIRAWRGVKPQNQDTLDAISDGISRWEPVWATKGREFIPYPATFLNQRRWEDTP